MFELHLDVSHVLVGSGTIRCHRLRLFANTKVGDEGPLLQSDHLATETPLRRSLKEARSSTIAATITRIYSVLRVAAERPRWGTPSLMSSSNHEAISHCVTADLNETSSRPEPAALVNAN